MLFFFKLRKAIYVLYRGPTLADLADFADSTRRCGFSKFFTLCGNLHKKTTMLAFELAKNTFL